MSTDTRPSVTVVGDLVLTKTAMAAYAYVAIDNLPDIGLKDGDEVEVTLRRHERLPANPWPAPRQHGQPVEGNPPESAVGFPEGD